MINARFYLNASTRNEIFFLSWNKHEQRGKTDTKTAKEKFLEKIAAKRKTASSFNLK